MKKLCLTLALLLCLTGLAAAENGVNMEVIKMDGVSVIRFTPEPVMSKARGIAAEEKEAGFVLPQMLTLIEEEAFAGISAATVEVSGNVVALDARAFADCPNLTRIVIPASVKKIDNSALAGCEGVTVCGEANSEAECFARDNGFDFIVVDGESPTAETIVREIPPAKLPYIAW